ncbi:MAG: fasciclin domain-containing protein [Bacteroidota bacterium]
MKNIKLLGSFVLAMFVIIGTSNAQCGSKSTSTTNSNSNTATYAAHKGGTDIVGLAAGTEDLSTLVAAVKAAGLVDVLQGEGPFTVFAPSNKAFEALPAGTVETLLKPENKEQLVQVLTYHVVAGKVMSTDLSNGLKAKTVQGETITVGINGKTVSINDATVTAADVKASNGVVHIIDRVILPPSMR